jgi:hypothetical protein
MMFPIGAQTVGIVSRVKVLDGQGQPVLTELREPVIEDSVVRKDGCLFEVQLPAATFVKQAENETPTTTTTKQTAWVILPPDDDTTAITNEMAIRYPFPDGNDYELRGDAVVEMDIRGKVDHVFCFVEYQEG